MPELVTIATYSTPEEAAVPRVALEGAGIATYLEGAAMVGNFWEYGTATGGIKLQVEDVDVEAALAVLAHESDGLPMTVADSYSVRGDRPDAPTAKVAGPPSDVCPKCGEPTEPGFEVCWSCGAEIDAPPEPPPADVSQEMHDAADLLARRAWRAAAVGFLFGGFGAALGLYALWLLYKLDRLPGTLSPRGRRHAWWAFVLGNLAIVPVLLMVAFVVVMKIIW